MRPFALEITAVDFAFAAGDLRIAISLVATTLNFAALDRSVFVRRLDLGPTRPLCTHAGSQRRPGARSNAGFGARRKEKSVLGRQRDPPRRRDPHLSRPLSYVRVTSPSLTRPSSIRREKPRVSSSASVTPNGLFARNSSARLAFGLRRRFRGGVAILRPDRIQAWPLARGDEMKGRVCLTPHLVRAKARIQRRPHRSVPRGR
jgi:hypothetical protein